MLFKIDQRCERRFKEQNWKTDKFECKLHQIF